MNEQRRNRRFNLKFPLELLRAGASVMHLNGETRNVSSGGVLFQAHEPVPVGEPIEYQITLPQDVRLKCVGKVIRSDRDDTFAATLERYEFVRASSRA